MAEQNMGFDLQPLSSRNGGVDVLASTLEKPLLDTREYRVIKLPNDLEALLIHDPETDKAAAAMDVNIGSFSDPEDMPGMAQAVEHLLFMGTEKYPGENDYNSYLTKYGGSSNSFTAASSTNYYFELSTSATLDCATPGTNASQTGHKAPLYGALDRFSQFFIRPLLLEATLDRELHAVDAENKKNLQSDPGLLRQLDRSASSRLHSLHYELLTDKYKQPHNNHSVKFREAVIDFYKEHYSADGMKLAVLGTESLDQLQSWVEECFAEVKCQNRQQFRWKTTQIPSNDASMQRFIKPGSGSGGPGDIRRRPKPTGFATRARGDSPHIPGMLAGKAVEAFGDYGASHNSMTEAYALSNGFEITAHERSPTILANARQAEVLGEVTLPFKFQNDREAHSLRFKVVRKCLYDVILGQPFLQATKTLTHFPGRILWKAKRFFMNRLACLLHGVPQEYVLGWMDGEQVHALPDMGSNVMLVSETYAGLRGWHVDRRPEHRIELELADESIVRCSGMVQNIEWNYDQLDAPTLCSFYVLPSLTCDVVLSCDFLCETQAFQQHYDRFTAIDLSEFGPGIDVFNIIQNRTERLQWLRSTAQKIRDVFNHKHQQSNTSSSTLPAQLDEFQKEAKASLQRLERADRLPDNMREAEIAAADADWERVKAKGEQLAHSKGAHARASSAYMNQPSPT